MKKLLTLSILALGGLVETSHAQDFSVPFGIMNTQSLAEKACSEVSSGLAMDEKKSTALVLWLGLCQPDYVNKLLTNYGLFVHRDGQYYYSASDTEPATSHDLMRSFYQLFGDIEVTDSIPDSSIPYKIIYYPLVTYGYNAGEATINVWTNFLTKMPIGELLMNPKSRELFCQSAELPKDEFHLSGPSAGYGPVACGVPGVDVGHREEVHLPDLPPAPKGLTEAETARNLICHEFRIRAARTGEINHDQLLDLTLENSVPVFSDINDPNSGVIGFEACIMNTVAQKAKKVDTFQFSTLPGVRIHPAMQRAPTYVGNSYHPEEQQWPPFDNAKQSAVQQYPTHKPGKASSRRHERLQSNMVF